MLRSLQDSNHSKDDGGKGDEETGSAVAKRMGNGTTNLTRVAGSESVGVISTAGVLGGRELRGDEPLGVGGRIDGTLAAPAGNDEFSSGIADDFDEIVVGHSANTVGGGLFLGISGEGANNVATNNDGVVIVAVSGNVGGLTSGVNVEGSLIIVTEVGSARSATPSSVDVGKVGDVLAVEAIVGSGIRAVQKSQGPWPSGSDQIIGGVIPASQDVLGVVALEKEGTLARSGSSFIVFTRDVTFSVAVVRASDDDLGRNRALEVVVQGVTINRVDGILGTEVSKTAESIVIIGTIKIGSARESYEKGEN